MNPWYTIRIDVSTIYNGQVISEVNGEPVSWEQTLVKEDSKLHSLLGDKNAKVSVSVSERLGSSRSYSSVSTHVSVTLTCNQDEKTIRRASHLAFDEAVAITDDIIPKAMHLLNAHIDRFCE